MSALDMVEKSDIRNLLGKSWLTHDGMWFYHTWKEFGVEKANILNRAAIKSLAPIEVQRMKKALGIDKEYFSDFNELMDFLLGALELTLPDSISRNVRFSSSSNSLIRWEWRNGECFAFKGMTQMGAIDGYRCGVLFRIECWLKALGAACSMHPEVSGCLMHEHGTCKGEFRVLLRD